MSSRFFKKGMEASGLTVVITAVILLAILLLAFYFLRSGGTTAKSIIDCDFGKKCVNPKATNIDYQKCGDDEVLSLKPCSVPDETGDDDKPLKGRCCTDPLI